MGSSARPRINAAYWPFTMMIIQLRSSCAFAAIPPALKPLEEVVFCCVLSLWSFQNFRHSSRLLLIAELSAGS